MPARLQQPDRKARRSSRRESSAVLRRVPEQLRHHVVLRTLRRPVLPHRVDVDADAAVFGGELDVLDRLGNRYVRQSLLPAGRASGVGPPHDVMRELAPGRELIPMRRAPRRAAIDEMRSAEEIGDAHHDHVLGRARLDRCRPGMAIAQHHHAVVLVRITLLEPLGQFVGKGHVTVGQSRSRFPMVMPVHQARFAIGMIPCPAVLTNAMPAGPAVVRRGVEFGQRRVLLQLRLDVGQPLLPDRRVRLAELHVLRAGMRAARAVRLQCEQLRFRFVKPLVPVAEGMSALASQRVELQPLPPRPLMRAAVALVAQRREVERAAACPDLRMVTKLERLERDPLLLCGTSSPNSPGQSQRTPSRSCRNV